MWIQGLKTASYDAVPQEHIFLFCFKAPAKFANWSLGRKKMSNTSQSMQQH